MRMRVVRDPRLTPGAEQRHVCPAGVTWVVSSRGITQVGADAFEAVWEWLTANGGPQSDELRVVTQIDNEPQDDVPLRFDYTDGVLTFWCHPEHFARATVNGATVEHREQVEGQLRAAV